MCKHFDLAVRHDYDFAQPAEAAAPIMIPQQLSHYRVAQKISPSPS
jgi:hypothetical protein